MNKSANKTPRVSTIHNMNLQRLALSQKQLSEILLQHEATTLYTDETSKYGKKIGGYNISDKEGNYYTLGFRDLVKVASYLADFDTRWPHEYEIFNFARFSSRIW